MSKELVLPNTVVVGDVCIDTNRTERGAEYTGWGGPGPYSARAAQKMGISTVSVFASYGTDFIPYRDGFTLNPGPIEGIQTLAYTNVTTLLGRAQTCSHAETAVPPKLTENMRHTLKAADIIVVAPLTPNYPLHDVRAILAEKNEDALTVLCPQGFFRDVQPDESIKPREFVEYTGFVPLADLVVISEEDTPDAFTQAMRWKQASPKTHVVVTQAAKGATIIDLKKYHCQVSTTPVLPEAVSDSVGCGDFFAMATAIAYWRSGEIVSAVQKGNEVARQKLQGIFATK